MRTNHHRLLLAFAAGAAIVAVASAQSSATSAQTQVERLLSRWTRSTPGCAVGADLKGAPVIRAAYGMADLEHDTPITLDTIFEAGSVSKQFTAAAVLLLVREGKLSLDDPIRKYYFSDEIETALDVAADGSRLVIRRRPDFTAALTPVYADGFNSGALGWVVFRRDGSGRVDGFSISQDRMWALAFTRQP